MKRVIYLNFLSFNSVNIGRMFTYLGSCCGHAPVNTNHLLSSVAQGGYTVSNQYRLINKLIGEHTSFILFKEDPATIENQLIFGYYHDCYDQKIIGDFKKYFGVEFVGGVIPNFEKIVSKYYSDVESYFNGSNNLTVVDLTPYKGKFNDFISSIDFINFTDSLNGPVQISLEKAVGMQGRVEKKKPFPYSDFLSPDGVFPSVPTRYPMNSYMGGFAFDFGVDTKDLSYLDYFIKDLNQYIQNNEEV